MIASDQQKARDDNAVKAGVIAASRQATVDIGWDDCSEIGERVKGKENVNNSGWHAAILSRLLPTKNANRTVIISSQRVSGALEVKQNLSEGKPEGPRC
jgi:hypothetical protein